MTLKYESEILFDLMKRDGDVTPSDVLPYESELKEKYLHQVEGAYPKLQDYRPEWLNYNLNAHLPADFPVESVSNVTNATFENVVPYAYGSAILKGQTLVNLTRRYYPDDNNIFHTGFTFTSGKSSSNRTMRMESVSTLNPMSFKPNTKYLIQIEISELNLDGETSIDLSVNESSSNAMFTGTTKFNITSNGVYRIITTTRDTPDNACVVFKGTSTQWEQHTTTNRTMTISHVMYLEYQEGMENWEIPYFTGTQSVKMPVLTTTGKNLFDGAVSRGYLIDATGQSINKLGIHSTNYMKCSPNTIYTISGTLNNLSPRFYFYDSDKNYLGYDGGTNEYKKFTALSNARYMRFRLYSNDQCDITLFNAIQVEESSSETSYEPYKSNILTVNEPIDLCGIGEVQDTMDCLKGELTQRVAEETLITTGWSLDSSNTSDVNIGFYLPHSNSKENGAILSEQYPTLTAEQWKRKSLSGIYKGVTNMGIVIPRSSLSAQSLTGFKEWLKQNPITIKYELATPVVKTVDLTATDQDGNTESIIRPIEGRMYVSTSSQTLPPLLDMSVPVEATSQNLMSFANILEEE